VLQDVFLFYGTVRDNLLFGKPDASDAEIEAAARAANAHDFIVGLPNGYDTLIGERGVKLSGGQKQRLSIARAILKDAPILILDEATSSVDTETELLIQQAIERLMRGRTTIVIAHRLSTVRNADKIVVLEDKAIVETGTHAELIRKNGLYKRLYSVQQELTPAPVVE
jgi:ABC-type multidrug transport system fused ATPase/permease subunit